MSIEEEFEKRLDFLFNNAIGVDHTIWYTNSETLRDAILSMFCELEAHRTWCNCYDTSRSGKPEQPSHSCTPCIADHYTPDSKHSGAKDSEVLNECDPEGMKPKSKYEKAFRDVK